MNLRKIYIAAAFVLTTATAGTACPAATADTLPGIGRHVKSLKAERSENNLFVSMQIDLTGMKLKSDREITYLPVLAGGDSLLPLPRVVVAGRNRYIQNLRHHRFEESARLCRPGQAVDYTVVVPYRPWMAGATLSLTEDLCGCGLTGISSERYDMAVAGLDGMREKERRGFVFPYAFITPEAEAVKTREARGSACIGFPVNSTVIRPAYLDNPGELQKIRTTIDLIRNDADTRITALSIRGFASPEGPYANNERLAKGRTEALAAYVRNLYAFDASIMATSWVAENWEDLRRYVATSGLEQKEGLLDIIDTQGLTPDEREQQLKNAYPAQYRFLLQNACPGMRRSDYAVEYVVRSYTSVDEIKAVMKTAPQKLSLQEMNLVAQSLEPGSEEYREVFEVAVRMFPDDPVANLNAANIALGRNELERAEAYLDKAGNRPQTTYARGVLAAKRGNRTEALALLEEARQAGVNQARQAIGWLRGEEAAPQE